MIGSQSSVIMKEKKEARVSSRSVPEYRFNHSQVGETWSLSLCKTCPCSQGRNTTSLKKTINTRPQPREGESAKSVLHQTPHGSYHSKLEIFIAVSLSVRRCTLSPRNYIFTIPNYRSLIVLRWESTRHLVFVPQESQTFRTQCKQTAQREVQINSVYKTAKLTFTKLDIILEMCDVWLIIDNRGILRSLVAQWKG